MNFIIALVMRYVNLAWSKIMRQEIAEDSNKQRKWVILSIIVTLIIVIPAFVIYFIFH